MSRSCLAAAACPFWAGCLLLMFASRQNNYTHAHARARTHHTRARARTHTHTHTHTHGSTRGWAASTSSTSLSDDRRSRHGTSAAEKAASLLTAAFGGRGPRIHASSLLLAASARQNSRPCSGCLVGTHFSSCGDSVVADLIGGRPVC